MRNITAALIVSVLLAACSIEGDILKLPEGWRLPNRQEATETWRNGLSARGLDAEGDFDGNGTVDLAYLLVSEKEGVVGLWVYMNGDKRRGSLVEKGTVKDAMKVTGIRLQEKPVGLPSQNPAIELFVSGGGSALLFWDPAAGSFKRVAMAAGAGDQ